MMAGIAAAARAAALRPLAGGRFASAALLGARRFRLLVPAFMAGARCYRERVAGNAASESSQT
jgi:hypothetical protein